MRDMSGETISQEESNRAVNVLNKFQDLSHKEKIFFIALLHCWHSEYIGKDRSTGISQEEYEEWLSNEKA